MAIHTETTFSKLPELATQVGFIVEGWTYVERILRDIIIYASPDQPDADLVASRLFHIGDLRREICETKKALSGLKSLEAEECRALLKRMNELLADRNTIIHGWCVGGGNQFGVDLHHFGPVQKSQGDPRDMSVAELGKHRRKVANAGHFLRNHLAALRDLVGDAERVLAVWRVSDGDVRF